jgi:hypothetical protein
MASRPFLRAAGGILVASAMYGGAFYWTSKQQQYVNSIAAATCEDSLPSTAAAACEDGQWSCAVLEQDHAAGFLDANRFLEDKLWSVEATNFNNHARSYGDVPSQYASEKRLPVPAVEVLKLRAMHYDHYELFEGTVPVLRIVGYFPDITPREVCEQLADPSSRLRWDANYRLFERLVSLPTQLNASTFGGLPQSPGGQSGVAGVLNSLSQGLGSGLLKAGRKLDAAVPPSGVVEDRAIMTHRVASKNLEMVGVAGRYFCYERVIRRYDIPFVSTSSHAGVPGGSREVFSLLYRSLPTQTMQRLVSVLCPAESQPKPSDVPVFMHSQEILLLPVSFDNRNPLLTERGVVELAVHKLRGIAGVDDAQANHAISSFLTTNQAARVTRRARRQGSESAGEGVLMIMTSVNDGKMPKGLPKWAERKVAQYFTTATYSKLHAAAVNKDQDATS